MRQDLSVLRAAIPYIRTYKDQTFVVKLSGALCDPGKVLENICEQISFLHQLGIRLVVVHGGGAQATRLAERLGVKSEFVAGRRVTSEEMLEVAKMTFAGTINTNLVAMLVKHGVKAVGLSGVDAGMALATKRPPVQVDGLSVDYGLVGDLTHADVSLLNTLMEADAVPVVCCLASDSHGGALNVNADTMASRIAQDIHAAKYCLLTTVDGVMRDVEDADTLYAVLDIAEAEGLIQNHVVSGGMLPKLTTAVETLRGGVPRVHIVNGATQDALLQEVFTNEGAGTLVVAER